MKMISLYCFCNISVFLLFLHGINVYALREKRTLIFPAPSSKIQLITGVGLPVSVEDISITMGYVVKAAYLLPKNVSDYTEPGVVLQRRKRNTQARWDMYFLISHFMERVGGKSCVLRTICELVDMPLDRNFGILEEILHIIFKPSMSKDSTSNIVNREYFAAEEIGKIARGTCKMKYSECGVSLLDLITRHVPA